MADVYFSSDPASEPSKGDLLAEVVALRQRVAEVEQGKQDMEVILEVTLTVPMSLKLNYKRMVVRQTHHAGSQFDIRCKGPRKMPSFMRSGSAMPISFALRVVAVH